MSDTANDETTTEGKPWYRRWWGIAGIILLVIIIGSALSGEDSDPTDTAAEETPVATEPAEETTGTTTDEPQETEPAEDVTEGQSPEEEPAPAQFEAQEFSGTGDDVLDVSIPDDQPAIAIFTHQGSQNFIVQGHGEDSDFPDGLVNAIGNYEGTRPINFGRTDPVRELEIQADGPWTIRVAPLTEAPEADNGQGDGVGDAVVRVQGGGRGAFTHDGDMNFIVEAYERFGQFEGMPIVNEIGPYEGTVRVPSDTQLLVIQADGNWTFQIT